MSHKLRFAKLIYCLLPLCMLSSCKHRALAQENEELKSRKVELEKKIESNKSETPEDSVDPVDPSAELKQAKADLRDAERDYQALQSANEKLKREHDKLKRQYEEDKKKYATP